MSLTQFPPPATSKNFNPFTFDPNVANSNIRLRESLKLKGNKILELKPFEKGTVGKVKFVQFAMDPDQGRWFAVKRPLDTKNFLYDRDHHIKLQKNCHKIAALLNDHPNFMKVFGHVLKKDKSGNDKPYLIMEYITGQIINTEQSLSNEQKSKVLSQIKDAMLHLAKNKIDPRFSFFKPEFFLTQDYLLKLIDFDFWEITDSTKSDNDEQLQLYSNCFHLGMNIAQRLIGTEFQRTDFTAEENESQYASLERCLIELIELNK